MTMQDLLTAVSVGGAVLTSVLSVGLQFWTVRINARSAERVAGMQFYQPRLCEALEAFAQAYTGLVRSDSMLGPAMSIEDESAAYRAFLAAGYRVLALLPDPALHRELTGLMDDLARGTKCVTKSHDARFRRIVELSAPYVSGTSSTRSKRSCREAR